MELFLLPFLLKRKLKLQSLLAAEELQTVLRIWEGVVYEADDIADSDANLTTAINEGTNNSMRDPAELAELAEPVTRQPESQPKKSRVEDALKLE